MRSGFFAAAFATLLFITSCSASSSSRLESPWPKDRTFPKEKSTTHRRDVDNKSLTYVPITSPYQNVFLPLSDPEAVSVTQFLHDQPKLNLTAAENATRYINPDRATPKMLTTSYSWDNTIVGVETLPPNKSVALPFLNGQKAALPKRYARATIKFAATDEPYYEDYLVGPLPVDNSTDWQPLTFVYNKQNPIQRVYDADGDKVDDFIHQLEADVAPILQDLLNATNGNDSLSATRIEPLWRENGDIIAWYQYWRNPSLEFDDGTLLPQGLYFKLNITGRDPKGWSTLGWYYGKTESPCNVLVLSFHT